MSRSQITELYRRLGPLVYARLRRSLKDGEAAASKTPEVFARLVQEGAHQDERSLCRFLKALD